MSRFMLKLIPLILMGAFIAAPIVVLADNQNPMRDAGQFMDDVTLATSVKAVILGDTGLKGFDVNVIVHNGNVQLSGYVDNQESADRAVKLAESVNGVKSVTNSLLIK